MRDGTGTDGVSGGGGGAHDADSTAADCTMNMSVLCARADSTRSGGGSCVWDECVRHSVGVVFAHNERRASVAGESVRVREFEQVSQCERASIYVHIHIKKRRTLVQWVRSNIGSHLLG